jgi:hypothetical protein
MYAKFIKIIFRSFSINHLQTFALARRIFTGTDSYYVKYVTQ